MLRDNYNEVIGLPFANTGSNTTVTAQIKSFETWLYESSTHYQTFQTEQMFRPKQYTADGSQWKEYSAMLSDWTTKIYSRKTDSNYGYSSYDFSNAVEGYKYATKNETALLDTTNNTHKHSTTQIGRAHV